MELDSDSDFRSLFATRSDQLNAYGEVKCKCNEAPIKANPFLHHLPPLFEMLNKRGTGEMWYHDEDRNFVISKQSMRGVHHGLLPILSYDEACLQVARNEARSR